ncbi:GAF domain-containing protein [Sulfurovum sp.]|uniref:GAF domain-containing protein n=1 Tax=Sulfurovum sp. TaxID=1969726 RepID=UPI0025D8B55E|nr:GAF domain-containing protein [Sulfurovum sp.]
MNENNTFQELVGLGHELLTNDQFEEGLSLISDHLTIVTGAERCSIFIYEKKNDELWTILATGIEKIHVPSEKGIVGYVFRTEDSVIENNVAKNIHFLSDIDKQSGYQTLNIIACPIYNSKKELIGVLELLNKPSGFNEYDLDFLNVFSGYIGSIIELAPFYFRDRPI